MDVRLLLLPRVVTRGVVKLRHSILTSTARVAVKVDGFRQLIQEVISEGFD